MKLLLDQNLSPRLVRTLEAVYPGSSHVRLVGLRDRDHRVLSVAGSDFLTVAQALLPVQAELSFCRNAENLLAPFARYPLVLAR